MGRNLAIFCAICLFLEFYLYKSVKTITPNTTVRIFYWVITLAVYAFIGYQMLHFDRSDKNPERLQILASLFCIFIIPKLFILLFLLLDDVFRLVQYGFHYTSDKTAHYPERRKFLSIMGLGFAAVLSALFIDGLAFGKYRHKVRKVKLKLPNLPESFKGYKIIQISDVHSGSFHHPDKLKHAIDLINEQDADLILFTGDMVNTFSDEFKPFIPLFKSIKSKDGKLSVFGNHDYGDYTTWKSVHEKQNNLEQLIDYEKQAGFDLLRNEYRIIEKNGEKIYILGVENWGLPPFPQYGDLDKAVKGIPTDAIKILMSHDPTHFDAVVKKHPSNVHLTLSGHTHGMQFGINLKNIKWSPIQYKYPKWADLYESEGKYLYVNRGFGVLAYPGRVGILPEITLFELI